MLTNNLKNLLLYLSILKCFKEILSKIDGVSNAYVQSIIKSINNMSHIFYNIRKDF